MNQVIFTKEEVAQIKAALESHSRNMETGRLWKDARLALCLLDSPRPRPKVKWDFLQAIYHRGHGDCENGNNPVTGYIGDICAQHGFDVED